jgi:hypothetical protein
MTDDTLCNFLSKTRPTRSSCVPEGRPVHLFSHSKPKQQLLNFFPRYCCNYDTYAYLTKLSYIGYNNKIDGKQKSFQVEAFCTPSILISSDGMQPLRTNKTIALKPFGR